MKTSLKQVSSCYCLVYNNYNVVLSSVLTSNVE